MQPSRSERNVFGHDAKLHPVTLMPLENGIGALPEKEQAAEHCRQIELAGDKSRADELRKKLGIPTSVEIEAASAAEAERIRKTHEVIAALPERVDALEARLTELERKPLQKVTDGHINDRPNPHSDDQSF